MSDQHTPTSIAQLIIAHYVQNALNMLTKEHFEENQSLGHFLSFLQN